MSNSEFRNKVRQIFNEYEQQIRGNVMSNYAVVYKNGAISRIEAAHLKTKRGINGDIS
jgi:uncharacterized protein YbcI